MAFPTGGHCTSEVWNVRVGCACSCNGSRPQNRYQAPCHPPLVFALGSAPLFQHLFEFDKFHGPLIKKLYFIASPLFLVKIISRHPNCRCFGPRPSSWLQPPLTHTKFGMAKYCADKKWHQFLNTTEKCGAKIPDCGTTSIDCEWWLPFIMCPWLVAVIPWRLLDAPTDILQPLQLAC